MTPSEDLQVLVIGLGNAGRGDDGAGLRVVELLSAQSVPGVRVIASGALDVTMAEDLAGMDLVVFVDAERRRFPPVRIDVVRPEPVSPSSAHSLSAAGLLGLALGLFRAAPRALLVTVAAPEMGQGKALTKVAEAASGRAASAIARLIGTRWGE